MITTLDELAPATRDAAHAWLDAALAVVDHDLRDAVRDELTIELCSGLDEESTPADLATLAARLGPIRGDDAEEPDEPAGDDPRVGTWFGIPYDWRPPTVERVRSTLWNPADPRVWLPRSFGAGWDLNLGAVAVRAGLIEPDAEDVPFASTPHDAFVLAAGLPALLSAAVVAHYAVRGGTLPARLPNHWGLAGEPDRWVSKGAAATADIGISAAATILATAAAASRTHGPGRAGRLAVAAMGGAFAATMTVLRAQPRGAWWAGPALAGSVVGSAGATLLGLALAGRDAERRRDLGAA